MDRLIVDGYNIVHAWPDLKGLIRFSLEAARDRLVERMAVFAQVRGADVTVVFDAHRTTAKANSTQTVDGVHVVFTRKGHSADHAIERLAYALADGSDPITVATSDRFQRDLVRGMGGAVISALELERQVIEAEKELGRSVDRYSR
ncbi:MAG TPA: NYN domain-containing protein [Candidatus Dormibacteraeota bacterium]